MKRGPRESPVFRQTLVDHYKDNPNVTVIVDRRTGPDRRSSGGQLLGGKRQLRNRRRSRIPGTFPVTDAPAEA